MIHGAKIQKWATPVTIGAFVVSAVSGVLLFFHLNFGLVRVVHEWGSWFLVIGALFHVIGSWRQFIRYFSKPAAWAIMAAFVLLLIVSLLSTGGGRGRKFSHTRLSKVPTQASFVAGADVARYQPDGTMKEPESNGIGVKGRGRSFGRLP